MSFLDILYNFNLAFYFCLKYPCDYFTKYFQNLQVYCIKLYKNL